MVIWLLIFFLAITYVLSTQMSMRAHFRHLSSKSFPMCKELFKSMCFDPFNCPLKIWESIGTLISKVGTHLGVCGFIPSHFPTLSGAWNVTPRFHFWLTPLQAFTLVASPRLRLWQSWKRLPHQTKEQPNWDKGLWCIWCHELLLHNHF
jgi:hypothetical protein